MLTSNFLRGRLTWLALIATSLLLAMTQGGPFQATPVGLIGVVCGQVWLPGWLLLRVLGEPRDPHPFAMLAWVLASGLGLTISLGTIAHLLHLSIPTYIVLFHAALVLLALLPVKHVTPIWVRLSRRALPSYVLLIACCWIAASVAMERNAYRFTGYEDQTFFIANAEWLIHYPDEIERTSRQAGQYSDRRFTTDGWTYNHAAWSWSSGVALDQLIWSDLTWLFTWTTPLIVFALAYEGTRRESAAVFSAAGLLLAGLLLLDPFAYLNDYRALGQNALFQVNTLRTFSITVMLPLALLLLLAYLRRPTARLFVLVALVAGALAILHPRQIIYFSLLTAACSILWFISSPTRSKVGALAGLALLTLTLLLLPSWQYFVPDTLSNLLGQQTTSPFPLEPASKAFAPSLQTEPTISEIVNLPATTAGSMSIFYHPLLVGIAIVGLLIGVRWRRDLLALYVVSATVTTLLFVYTPGWSDLIVRTFADSNYGASLLAWAVVMLPVGPAIGLAIEVIVRPLGHYGTWFGTLSVGLVIGLVLIEPFPIPASARDQLRSANALQMLRDRPTFDTVLLNALVHTLPTDPITTVLTSNAVSGGVNEVIPNTLIVTGRNTNQDLVYERGLRFYDPAVPWLDQLDLELINELDITYLVVAVTDSRLTQIELDPARFTRLTEAAGYRVYRVLAPVAVDSIDERFGRMNELLMAGSPQRIQQGELALAVGGNPHWRPLLGEWRTADETGNDRARYGLALSALLTGDDALALPLWRDLHTRYPEIPFFGQVLASTLRETGQPAEAAAVLLQMTSAEPVGLLAVRDLLSSQFFYLLSAADIERLIALTETAPEVWSQIAEYEQPEAVRQRAGLFIRAGNYAQAAKWLERIPLIRQTPNDLLTLSLLDLARGSSDGALARLQPLEDADVFVPNRAYNPAAWGDSHLLAAYHAMRGGERDSLLQALQATALPLLSMYPVIGQQQVDIQALAVDLPLLPAAGWRARLISPDGSTHYAMMEIAPVPVEMGQLTVLHFALAIPDSLPTLSPVRVVVEPIYADGIQPSLTTDVWLPLPPSAVLPDASQLAAPVTFGNAIRLLGAESTLEANQLNLTLYWQVIAEAPADLQVFVQVLDENGAVVAQQDSRPIEDRYPFHIMLPDSIVRDPRQLMVNTLSPGEYRVIMGVYHLSDLTRLPISGSESAQADHIEISQFTLEG